MCLFLSNITVRTVMPLQPHKLDKPEKSLLKSTVIHDSISVIFIQLPQKYLYILFLDNFITPNKQYSLSFC